MKPQPTFLVQLHKNLTKSKLESMNSPQKVFMLSLRAKMGNNHDQKINFQIK